MKLLCTSCQLLREPRDEREAKSPLPFVCSVCRAKAAASAKQAEAKKTAEAKANDPAAAVKSSRPQLQLDFDDSSDQPPSSEGDPVSLRDVELLSERGGAVAAPPSSEGDPVSLRDLEVIFTPGHAPPPLIANAKKFNAPLPVKTAQAIEAPPEPKAEAHAPPAPPPPAQAADPSGDDREVPDSVRAFALDMPLVKRGAKRPRQGSIDSSVADLQLMEAMAAAEPRAAESPAADEGAPLRARVKPKESIDDVFAVPVVRAAAPAQDDGAKEASKPPQRTKPEPPKRGSVPPPAPLFGGAAAEPEEPKQKRDPDEPPSGLVDIRKLVASTDAPAPNRGSYHEIDTDLFNLSGGLFNDAPIAPVLPLAPPEVTAPEKDSEKPAAKKAEPAAALTAPKVEIGSARPPPSAPRKAASAGAARRSVASSSAPVVAEPSAPPAKPRSMAWALAVAAAAALAAFWFMKQPKDQPAIDKPVNEAAQRDVPHKDPPPASTTTSKPSSTMQEPTIDDTSPSAKASAKPADAPTASATANASATTARPPSTDAPSVRPPSSAAVEPPPRATTTPSSTVAPPVTAPPATTEAKLPEPVTAQPTAPPAPPSGGADFDKAAAKAALATAASHAAGCRKEGDPTGIARLSVTFAPSGRVTSPRVEGPPFQGTATGGCISQAFRGVTVPPFEGSPVTVSYSVNVQ